MYNNNNIYVIYFIGYYTQLKELNRAYYIIYKLKSNNVFIKVNNNFIVFIK